MNNEYNQDKKEIIEKFKEINKQGFISTNSRNSNSSGILLENLLGRRGYEFNIPDYGTIEIKTLRDYNKAEIDLFSSSADGLYIYPMKWLSENYGYPDKIYKNIKIITGNIYANKLNKIGLYYYYRLNVDTFNQKINIHIYNRKKELINNDIFWDFSTLKEKLLRKDKHLAIFTIEKYKENNIWYVKYNNLEIYTLKSFEEFINCIKNGIVSLTIKTGVNKSGYKKGEFKDHGASFRIEKNNMHYLFDKEYIHTNYNSN